MSVSLRSFLFPPRSRYVAIYPYTPRKEDELELRKGEMFLVFERCQDGWFKGTSMHTSKIGVFPGNYVAPVTRYDDVESGFLSSRQRLFVPPQASQPIQSPARIIITCYIAKVCKIHIHIC